MSKERELLERVLTSELWSVQEELQSKIRELLAEPEQKPAAWMYEFTGELDVRLERTARVILLLEKQDWVESRTTGSYVESPLYTSPKREPPITSREMYQRGYAAAERDLKREPLSDEWIKDNIHLIHQDVSFTDLVRSIEKAHGIGGGE